MYSWGTSLDRKKHQRRVNKAIRALNKNIVDDELWRGRFEARQIRSDFYVFDDKSGAILTSFIEMVDKKTHQAALVRIEESQFFDYHVWEAMNDFITTGVKANCERSEIDYSKIEVPPRSYGWWREHWHELVIL